MQKIRHAPSWSGARIFGWSDWRNVFLFWIEFLLEGTPEAIQHLSLEGHPHV
jgi:hypothetical protein